MSSTNGKLGNRPAGVKNTDLAGAGSCKENLNHLAQVPSKASSHGRSHLPPPCRVPRPTTAPVAFGDMRPFVV
jgi:hypothetical protein